MIFQSNSPTWSEHREANSNFAAFDSSVQNPKKIFKRINLSYLHTRTISEDNHVIQIKFRLFFQEIWDFYYNHPYTAKHAQEDKWRHWMNKIRTEHTRLLWNCFLSESYETFWKEEKNIPLQYNCIRIHQNKHLQCLTCRQ